MTDDVLPSEFPLFVTENLIESRMVGMDPSVKAAAKALLDARMNPGSLIKITCSNSDECARVGQVLAHTIVVNNLPWGRRSPSPWLPSVSLPTPFLPPPPDRTVPIAGRSSTARIAS